MSQNASLGVVGTAFYVWGNKTLDKLISNIYLLSFSKVQGSRENAKKIHFIYVARVAAWMGILSIFSGVFRVVSF